MNYRVFEMETIAILEALLKWEDKLLGRKILIVTDHKALEFFKTQRRLNSRQARWMEFLARFDYDITYVRGETNLVADALSRYYKNDQWTEPSDKPRYVTADARLDPEGEDLPWDRFEEVRAMRDDEVCARPLRQRRAPRRADEPVSFAPKHPVIEAVEARQREAADLVAHGEPNVAPPPADQLAPLAGNPDPTVGESLGEFPDLRPRVEGDLSILSDIRVGYSDDTLCRDSLLYEQWATTRDLSWMRLMKRRRCVTVMRNNWSRTKARMWEGSRVVGVDKRIV